MCFQMDKVVVWCIRGPPGKRILAISKVVSLILHTTISCISWLSTNQVDRTRGWPHCSSTLIPQLSGNSYRLVYHSLTTCFGRPEINGFAAPDYHFLPMFLTGYRHTEARGLEMFTVLQNRWRYNNYLFLPPAASVLLHSAGLLTPAVILQASDAYCTSVGSSTMVQLLQWCPFLPLLSTKGFQGRGVSQLGTSLHFHA